MACGYYVMRRSFLHLYFVLDLGSSRFSHSKLAMRLPGMHRMAKATATCIGKTAASEGRRPTAAATAGPRQAGGGAARVVVAAEVQHWRRSRSPST